MKNKSPLIFVLKWSVLVLAVVYGLVKVYFISTDGFSVANISYEMPFQKEFEMHPLNETESKVVKEALGQPYTYLAKGHQAYAFISQDHRFVIKFLKFQRITVHPFILGLPLSGSFDEWRQEKIDRKKRAMQALFQSWKLGFEEFKDEAGLVMVHINRSDDLHQQIIIKDKLGLTHKLNADDMVFLIQKTATLATSDIEDAMKSGNEEGARQIIAKLMNLFLSEYKRGITEKDQYIVRNAGMLEGNPIHIDTGRFIRDDNLRRPEVYKKEIRWKMWKFDQWLKDNYPSLSNYLHELLETVE